MKPTPRSLLVTLTIILALASRVFAPEATPDERKLFIEGAKLWPVYCAQCHNARPGSQFSPTQWDAITMHMRTQSIMPAKDIRAIKEFLQQAR
jgi:mono/diheme cytochrome c family protein